MCLSYHPKRRAVVHAILRNARLVQRGTDLIFDDERIISIAFVCDLSIGSESERLKRVSGCEDWCGKNAGALSFAVRE